MSDIRNFAELRSSGGIDVKYGSVTFIRLLRKRSMESPV